MNGAQPSVFVHIVTWNSDSSLDVCIRSVLAQKGFVCPQNLEVVVTDNGSLTSPIESVKEKFGSDIRTRQNRSNLGFCGAHNQGAHDFLKSGKDFFCVLNPDVRLESDTLSKLIEGCTGNGSVAVATPLLLRANQDLSPIEPLVIDAAGMVLESSLRHFDRGSGSPWNGQFTKKERVFGGTGACLLLSRAFVEAALVPDTEHEDALFQLYPDLRAERLQRAQLFDEAFFAYREDADLSWRATNMGWESVYVPTAVAYHRRVVTPERRAELPAMLNRLGVRNRFLLQLNNATRAIGLFGVLNGLIFRNLIVIMAVMLVERSSLGALKEAWQLRRRALARRRHILKVARQ